MEQLVSRIRSTEQFPGLPGHYTSAVAVFHPDSYEDDMNCRTESSEISPPRNSIFGTLRPMAPTTSMSRRQTVQSHSTSSNRRLTSSNPEISRPQRTDSSAARGSGRSCGLTGFMWDGIFWITVKTMAIYLKIC